MDIQLAAPPALQRKRTSTSHKYADLFRTVRELDGDWASVSLGDMSNTPAPTLHAAARSRRMVIQTSIQAGRIYVRYVSALGTK